MKKFFKIVGWIALAVLGLAIWFAFPDIQPVVTAAAVAVFAYNVVGTIIRETVRGELSEMRREVKLHTSKLEEIDRKVSATLRDALERRRAGF